MPTTIFIRIQWLCQTRALLVENDDIVFVVKQRICFVLGLNVDIYCTKIRLKYGPFSLQNERSLTDYNICNNTRIQCSLPRVMGSYINRTRNLSLFDSYPSALADTNIRTMSADSNDTTIVIATSPPNNSPQQNSFPMIVENTAAVDANLSMTIDNNGTDVDITVAEVEVDNEDMDVRIEDEKKEVMSLDDSNISDERMQIPPASMLSRVCNPILSNEANIMGIPVVCNCNTCKRLKSMEEARIKQAIEASIEDQKDYERRNKSQIGMGDVTTSLDSVIVEE